MKNRWPIEKMHDAYIQTIQFEIQPKNGKEGFQDILIVFVPFGGTAPYPLAAALFHNCSSVLVDRKPLKRRHGDYSNAEFDTAEVYDGHAVFSFNSVQLYEISFDYTRFKFFPLE
ncbi:MAG: hypothetical protein BWY98_00598 [Tenericutes bacterium ADurb.BinA155]|jgi:hypothetical protein|nr:MAG: hypothetical protein BWY98_00598 [Tenericutes bacterium ADurb.BinA155]